ncbi:unnamed protein product [Ceutorhynchus assimilis]|uniref:Major facilitator superfamily (MFS) profile domain-containing protein n=1 Tax=Ceutorhynchus assimilis TaxID=467358 RepID=A0A9N9QNZ2_9CUCU|nr:unnamed protein product [Ceutorhynchus assimilis]
MEIDNINNKEVVNDEISDKPNIPDGGWGWVVVFATFVLCMIADGITFSFGLLYIEFLNEFEASKSATSWIGALFMAVPLMTGPLMSALVDKFGCRPMTIVGGLIAALGFVLSSQCYSLSYMYVTFGVIAGFGLGLIYVTVVVSVAFWFEKKRTLAVGIGSSGIGIGTFVFSPFSTYLIEELGWRGTTLILAGVFLNMCICGALMRDPDWIIEQNKKEAKLSKNPIEIASKENGNQVVVSTRIKESRQPLMARQDSCPGTRRPSIRKAPIKHLHHASMLSLSKLDDKKKWYASIKELGKDMFDFSLFSELHFFLLSLSTVLLFTWFIVPYFYLADLMTLSGYTTEQAAFTISNIGISNTIGMIVLGWAGDKPWMNITITYGIFLVLCGLSIMGQMWFIGNYIMLQISASLFGISLSSHFAFTPGIVMELVPLDRFTIAYGLQLMCQGIGTLVGPPFAGLLFDLTQNWEQSFYQSGLWMILSGIFVGCIPYIKNKKMFGKGLVEKPIEGQENKIIPLVLLSILMIVSLVAVFYLPFNSYF